MQVGFIGLGTMGAGMAANLQKAGYKLLVHDIRQDSATPHLKAGAKWTETPKALAAQSNVIFTSLPGPPEVEAVALGLIEGMEKGRGRGRAARLVGSGALRRQRAPAHLRSPP